LRSQPSKVFPFGAAQERYPLRHIAIFDLPSRETSFPELDGASNFCWRGGMLLYGLTNAQCCFDALD